MVNMLAGVAGVLVPVGVRLHRAAVCQEYRFTGRQLRSFLTLPSGCASVIRNLKERTNPSCCHNMQK